MRRKLFVFSILFLLCFNVCASASILGDVTGGWSEYMGADTVFYNFEFTSPSVGKQNEYYIEYSPNTEAVPVIVNGKSIWGTRNIKSAEEYMEENGLRPLAGINGDYFSFTTGIPMGHTIIDGEIASKEYGGQDAIGFRADGSAFIDWLDIRTVVERTSGSKEIDYINKWCQQGYDPIYLLTDKFGSSSKTNMKCIFVICTPTKGRLAIGDTMEAVVDDVFEYDGAIDIPEGKIVFVMDAAGDFDNYSFLSTCRPGETLKITNEALGDDGKWKTAENGISSVGGRLIKNGEVQSGFDAETAPRTAVGVCENGNVLFYTIDGRQQGYSYGVQLNTLAKRLGELGCVDAINLDGGGSTTISAYFPGTDAPAVVNKPSDGYLRSVANYVFLRDMRERTDIPWIVNLKDAGNKNFLSGMTTRIEIDSVYDTANYRMSEPYGIDYEVVTDTDSEVDDDGNLTFWGTGEVGIVLENEDGEIAYETYQTYETPDQIKIYNQADWKEIDSISVKPSEEFQLVLSAASYINDVELKSNNTLYTWETEGDIGTVNEYGIFTLSSASDAEGNIIVSAGDTQRKIPVHISNDIDAFADTREHWARALIDVMAERGILSGMEEDGLMVFKPDNNMTRAEFASMIVNYLGLDVNSYSSVQTNFKDNSKIPLWAQNAVKAVYKEKIIEGRVEEDGTVEFAPEEYITRAEVMTIMGRILKGSANGDINYADSADIPLWAMGGIKKLSAMGIINGYEDNTILPLKNITRAEAAALIYKTETQ